MNQSQQVFKAIDMIEGQKYAFISAISGGPSEIGYVQVKIVDNQREYLYRGIKTGLLEKCHPTASAKFILRTDMEIQLLKRKV